MKYLLLCLLLTGCVFQPTIFNMKLVADGASYVATGKSTTDNVASSVTQKDCDTFNLLDKDKTYCMDKKVVVEPPKVVVVEPPNRNGLKVKWRKPDVRHMATTTEKRVESKPNGNKVLLASHRANTSRPGLHKLPKKTHNRKHKHTHHSR